jgi:hypothetical protein
VKENLPVGRKCLVGQSNASADLFPEVSTMVDDASQVLILANKPNWIGVIFSYHMELTGCQGAIMGNSGLPGPLASEGKKDLCLSCG